MHEAESKPTRQIRAVFDDNTITVYQAFNKSIAETAVNAQTFVCPPFKRERMTWIKPSFLWMMYRSGWATKENQEHVLSIKIKRVGFEWALQNSCLSHFDKSLYSSHDEWKEKLNTSPVRIQWDPEKDIYLQPLPYKSIQIGLSGVAVEKYINEWIVGIEDITKNCKMLYKLIQNPQIHQTKDYIIPFEKPYPLPDSIY